jgi:hypothetical protein
MEVDIRQQGRDNPSNNIAKTVIDFSITIPREQLRPGYGDGFGGAPLDPAGSSQCRTARNRGVRQNEPSKAEEDQEGTAKV